MLRRSVPRPPCEAPIDLLLELLLSGLFDLVVEVLFHGLGGSRRSRTRAHPVVAALALLAVGAATGALVTLVLPTRLLGPPLVPGASLVLSPLLNGVLMHAYGTWTARRARSTTFAATFWGGAAFAFGFALVRLLMVVD